MLVQHQQRHRSKSLCVLWVYDINPDMVHHRLRGLFKHVTLNNMPANTRHIYAQPRSSAGQMMSQHWTGIAPISGVSRDVG